MKKLWAIFAIVALATACNEEKKETPEAEKAALASTDTASAASTVKLPYTATYSSNFNDKVADEDVLTVLNSYKYWESGDIASLEGTLADSVYFTGADATIYSGPKAGLLDIWKKRRESMSSVSIEISAWVKSHSIDKDGDFVNVWYKEIDTYKNGKVDSANFEDINALGKGKIAWFAQYRQELVKKK